MAAGDPIVTIGVLDRKLDEVIAVLHNQDEKLWGKNGFEGDIVRIHNWESTCTATLDILKKCATDNAGEIKVLKATKLGWRDWKFIAMVVAATLAAGGAGAGVAEAVK